MSGPEEQDPLWRRWAEIDRLFQTALDRPPEARTAWIDEVCGADRELADAVLALLADAPERAEAWGPSSMLLRDVFTEPPQGPVPLRELEPGQVVGRFRVLRELGRGGMAIVYEAERVDGAYDQRVALKVLGRGLENDESVRRFLVERQILSRLEHPNIAHLLDGGSTSDGHPYLVMELVRGEPLTSWADRRGLTIEERLALFVQVAAAVGYAHAHLVVHRDLKPANVLVGDDGRVKLLDFGIAKLVEAGAESGADAGAETHAPTLWMTPRYASPEQILGRPVTTASDVHALGVILYELLTARRPFGGEGTTAFEVQRAICEGTVDRPSAGSPAALARRLRGDLDAIVLKALRREPAERYATVQALVDDVERHLAGYPVHARSGAWAYRARKFVGRNWLAVGAAAALVATLVGGSVLLALQQRTVVRERDRATREAANAGLVIDFLADVFRGRDPTAAPSDTITARELLAWGRERVDQEFGGNAEVHAELLAVLGQAHSNLGLYDEGIELHERSLALTRDVYGEGSAEVAEGLAGLAGLHQDARAFEAALPVREEAVRIRRARAAEDGSAGTMAALGADLRGLAGVYRDLGRLDEAEASIREAITLHRRTVEDDSTELVQDMLSLAYVLRARGQLDEAEALYEETIPRFRALAGPTDPDLAMYLNNLAYLRRVREDFAGAEPLYREALAITADVYGRGHPTAMMLGNNLASVLHEQGRVDDLLHVMREQAEAAAAQWPDGHWRVGSARGALGSALLRNGRAREALEPLDEAVLIFVETLGASHDWTAFERATRAIAWVLTGREREGRDVLDRFHRGLEARALEGGLARGTVDLLEPLISTLEDTGLIADAERFRALLPGEPSGG